MAKKAIDATQGGTVFLVEPEKLTRVTETEHPLYDPRVHDKPEPWLVKSILNKGYDQTQIVIVRKNGPLLEIVDGRHKHAAVLEVNRLRAEELGDNFIPIKIPVVVKRAKSDAEFAETMLITTYLRKADNVLIAAEKVSDYMSKFGRSPEEAADIFGLSVQSIKIYLKLVELADPVKAAVRAQQISAHDAVKSFYNLTRAEQVKQLASILASSPKGKAKGIVHDTGETGEAGTGNPKVTVTPIKRLRTIYRNDEAMEALTPRERTLLNFIYGQVSLNSLHETHHDLAKILARKPKPGRKTGLSK